MSKGNCGNFSVKVEKTQLILPIDAHFFYGREEKRKEASPQEVVLKAEGKKVAAERMLQETEGRVDLRRIQD